MDARMDGFEPSGAEETSPITVTWAKTSSDPAKRERLGKIRDADGKWRVAPGVQRRAFVYEDAHYVDLEDFAGDLDARMRDGGFALLAGRLKLLSRTHDRNKAYPRTAENLTDYPCWLLSLDFDGLAAADSRRIDRPEDFSDASALREALKRLPAAFRGADCVLYATSSTGLETNAKGEPANGRARFRVVFWLKRPLTFADQKQIALALKQRDGLNGLDVAIYSIPQFSFVDRPEFLDGTPDPIQAPVLFRKGDRRQVDVDALLSEVGVSLTSKRRPGPGPRPPAGAEERRLDVASELRVPLIRQAVAAIVNDLDRVDWVHFAHAIDGSLDDEPEGRDIFLEFSERWVGEFDDPYEAEIAQGMVGEGGDRANPEAEAERVWDTRGEGRAGFGYLMQLLTRQGTREAEAAIEAIQQERARTAFRDPPPEDPDDDDGSNDDDDDDDALLARRAPTIDPRAFYGPLLKRIVTEVTARSEATAVGLAAQIMAHVSTAMRPFFNPLGDNKIPFNVYFVQLGPSGKGRKGTSASIVDDSLGPALLRLAEQIQARIAFPDRDEDARNEAAAEVEEAARHVTWTRNVSEDRESEIEARLATLRDDHEAAAREIAERKARLKAKTRAHRTVREEEKLIAAAEAKRVDNARSIAADEVELAEVRQVLKDEAAALARAKAAHDAAQAKLDGLPPPAPPAPGLALFASLAEGPVTTTGVSTGEGLIELIRDPGRKQGPRGPVDDPGVTNKCLFLNLDELGSVLAVIMRPGATLSSVLRTMWDCRRTELVNKNSSTRCKEPYVTMSASITPGELMGRLFDKRDAASSADNGLGNRLLYVWVKRDKLKARPLATPGLDEWMDTIASNILRVYEILNPTAAFLSTPIDFSAKAYARYELEYPRIANLKAAGRKAAKLIERLPVYLRKIAGILTVMNGEHEISEGALEAALAWIEYSCATVNAIAATAADRKNTRVLADDGAAIMAALKVLGGGPVSSREVQRKTRLPKERFDAGVGELMQQAPAPITISESPYTSGRGARRTRALLTLNASAAEEDDV